MKKVFRKIREFIWPLLEKEEKPSKVEETESTEVPESDANLELVIADENLEEAFNLKSKIFESEEDRRKGIETKASIFISTISLITSIVVAANALISGNAELNIPVKVSVAISFILSIYAIRTVWFSIKALERGAYHVIDFRDINFGGTKVEYYRHLIKRLEIYVDYNNSIINKKVDYFTLAQEYYKRVICVIGIYSLSILFFCFCFKKEDNKQRSIQVDRVQIINLTSSDSVKKNINTIILIDTNGFSSKSNSLKSTGNKIPE